MILDTHTIIGNSCASTFLIQSFYPPDKNPNFIEHTNPFISSLFLNDDEFVRLAANYDHYLSLPLIIDEPKRNTAWFRMTGQPRIIQTGTTPIWYPVSHLGDVETHWIHGVHGTDPAENCKHYIPRAFWGRYKLGKHLERIFVWSVSEMYNLHTEEERAFLIKTFLSIKDKSIFLTNRREESFEDKDHIAYPVPQFIGAKETDRCGNYLLSWNSQAIIADIAKTIIEKKW